MNLIKSKIVYIFMILAIGGLLLITSEISSKPQENERSGLTLTLNNTLADGTVISVIYRPDILKRFHNEPDIYIEQVLEYAKEAYNDIVHTYGFNSSGFTFSDPNTDYAFDKDRKIEILIGLNTDERNKQRVSSEINAANFQDTVRPYNENLNFNAIIDLPADYESHLAVLNIKQLSKLQLKQRLRSAIYHEIFSIILYTYNRHLRAWVDNEDQAQPQFIDWYVRGLSSYISTLPILKSKKDGGYATNNDKNGDNPEKARGLLFSDIGSDKALFWAYIHKRYGMDKIEKLSQKLRFISKGNVKDELPKIFAAVFEENFDNIMAGFSVAIFFKNFSINDTKGLKGFKIMSLDDFADQEEAVLPSLASNFITLNLNKSSPKHIWIKKANEIGEMSMNVFIRLGDGKISSHQQVSIDTPEDICLVNLQEMKQGGVKELILVITNIDSDYKMNYNILQTQ
ncbi:hypothetical protein ACFL0T_01200 [Candidatus Omnitrophota bacterium]